MRFLDIFERQDVARQPEYTEAAVAILRAWMAQGDAMMPLLYPFGRGKPSVTGYERSQLLEKLSLYREGGTLYIFSASVGSTKGSYSPKEKSMNREETITVHHLAFAQLLYVRENASYYNNPYSKPKERREARINGLMAWESVKSTVTHPEIHLEILETLVHEMTHQRDNKRWPLSKEMDQRSSVLTKKMHAGSLTHRDEQEWYMKSTHEYNAYFMHALHTAMAQIKAGRTPSFEEFKAVVLKAIGPGHFSMMPVDHQKKIQTRIYLAYQDLTGKQHA